MATSKLPNPSAAPRPATLAISLNIAIGIWLLFAPAILDFATTAAQRNAVFVGVCVLTLACIQISVKAATRAFSAINLLFGVWLFLAPFVLSYDQPKERWHDWITGLLLVTLCIISLRSPLRVRSGATRS